MTQTQTKPADPRAVHAAHAALISRVAPHIAGWRGCGGVALILDGEVVSPAGEGKTGQGFLPNAQLTWVTGLDIPVPWISGLARSAHLMQVRRAALRYGAPVLDRTTVLREFDYWDGPRPELELAPEVALAANGINAAMTSTAFAFREAWGVDHAPLFAAYSGLPVGQHEVMLGDRRYAPAVVRDMGWVPLPWVEVDPRKAAVAFERLKALGYTLAFRALACELFAVGMPIVSPVEGFFTGTSPLVSGGVQYTQYNFREGNGAKHAVVATGRAKVTSAKGLPVFRGTQVGRDAPAVPAAYLHWSRERQWGELTRTYSKANLHLVLGNVFSALFRGVGKKWLLPYEAIGGDVSYAFGGGGLWWDVSPVCRVHKGVEYDFSFKEDGRVHVMPTVWLGQWDDFTGYLGATAVDLHPQHPAFASHALNRQIRRFPATTDGRSGDAQGEVVPTAVVPGRPVGVLPEIDDDLRAAHLASAANRAEWASRRTRRGEPAPKGYNDDRVIAPFRPQ